MVELTYGDQLIIIGVVKMNKYTIRKSFLSFLTAGMTALSCHAGIVTDVSSDFLFSANAAEAAPDMWDGTSDISWYMDDTTSFYISTAEQLAGLAQLVNSGNNMSGKAFYLKNDIQLNDISNYIYWETQAPSNNWTPIGESRSYSFNGTFDGQGHKISGMYQHRSQFNDSDGCGGFFGALNWQAIVRNVNLNYAYVSLVNGTYAGGICGYGYNCGVSYSSYNGKVSLINSGRGGYAGGVFGYSNNAAAGICRIYGSVYTKITSNAGIWPNAVAGGICGMMANGYMSDSYSEAMVNVEGDSQVFSYGGGICGRISDGTVSGCRNMGIVTVNGYRAEAGGIAGEVSEMFTIENCCNNDAVISNSYSGKSAFTTCGGIAGSVRAYDPDTCFIKNVYNSGNIDSNGYGGAIIGYVWTDLAETLISNCYWYEETAQQGIEYGTDTSVSLSRAEMYSENLAISLGNGFIFNNGGFPLPEWEITKSSVFKFGDVDYSGTVDPVDATLVLQQYAIASMNGKNLLTDEQINIGNVDTNYSTDGVPILDVVDATHILRYHSYSSMTEDLTWEDLFEL